MRIHFGLRIFPLFLLLFLSYYIIHAENNAEKRLNKTSSDVPFTKLNLNNITTFIYNDGQMDLSTKGMSGFEFPRGSKRTAIFQSGFVFGSKINGSIRVGGVTYNSGLQPGKIISPGKAEDPALPKNRLYRVRPDYKTAVLNWEMLDQSKSESELRNQYEKDWNDWPALDGAPYTDINNDGKYDPKVDMPGVKDAVQTIWYVLNDMDQTKSQGLYGSPSSGLELQITLWTYDKDFNLKNTYFKKYKIINKSSDTLSDMYVSLWSDPDNGDAANDFAGCDSTLGLGFCYNADAVDAIYGSRPPATGIDLMQGPVVNGTAGDTAIFDWRKIPGKKNLPVTSFYYNNSSAELADPLLGSSYNNTLHWYNQLQGKMAKIGEYFPVPPSVGGGTTKFPLSGDPVAKTGYLDGILYLKGDRRMGINSGPFNMAPGDTQEVVYAQMAAQGTDNISSVSILKNMDIEIQKKYNNLLSFQPSYAPQALKPSASYNKESITVSWPQDAAVENFDQGGFKFQGYNVYQINPNLPETRYGVKIAAFDLADGITKITGEEIDTLTGKPITAVRQNGTDSGIKRAFITSRDSLEHTPLYIGKKYHYAVTAYTYRNDPAGKLTTSESPLGYVSVVFQEGLPGLKYKDTLRVAKKAGNGNAKVVPVVIDAAKVTGHDYQVFFANAGDSVTWSLKDLKTGQVLLTGQKILNETELEPDRFNNLSKDYLLNTSVTDGINVNVINSKPGMTGWTVPKGSLKWSSKRANTSGTYILRGFDGAIGDGYIDWATINYYPAGIRPGDIPHTLIKFASTDTDGNILDPTDPNVSYAYRYMRSAFTAPAKPEFAPFIINKGSGYAYQDFKKNLPFAAYNNETGQRLSVGFVEYNAASGRVDGKYWPPADTDPVGSNSSSASPREWVFIFNVPYSQTPDTKLQADLLISDLPVIWFGMPTRSGNAAFSAGDEFLIMKNNLSAPGDVYTFMTDWLTGVNEKSQVHEFSLAQNYPNPFNPVTTIRYAVPEQMQVELKVYDILGREVKTLVNTMQKGGEYNVQFDGSSLSSGMYIYTLKAGSRTESRKLLLLK